MKFKNHIKKRMLFAVAFCFVFLFSFSRMHLFANAKESTGQRIPEGISINGTDVSNMTFDEASEALSAEFAKYQNAKITLTAGDREYSCMGSDLSVDVESDSIIEAAINYGQTGNILERFKAKQVLKKHETKDFKISPCASAAAISEYLQAHISEIEKAPVNYGLTRENGEFQITEGSSGYTIDVTEAASEIVEAVSSGWEGEDLTVTLSTTVVEPEGSPEVLAQVTDKMGTYTTDYSTSAAGRKQNVANGASKINGTVLYPGEQISIGSKLNPISLDNGYAMAGAYENGTTVEAVGGGVCQISSTIYNAVIRAELQVDERYPHSMTVHYVDPSADAAIAGDYKDLKFTNNTQYPIYLELITTGSTITCNVYGKDTREAGRSVDFVSEILETETWTRIYKANASQPIGYLQKTVTPYTGYQAKLVKIVYMNGVEQSREDFNTSKYKKIDAEYEVGTASANGGTDAMNAAIATQDEAIIKATMAQYADAAFTAEVQAQQAAAAAATESSEASSDTSTDTSEEQESSSQRGE